MMMVCDMFKVTILRQTKFQIFVFQHSYKAFFPPPLASILFPKMWSRPWRSTVCTGSSSATIHFSSSTTLDLMACISNSWPPCFKTCFPPLMCTRYLYFIYFFAVKLFSLLMAHDSWPCWHDDSIVFWVYLWGFIKSKRFLISESVSHLVFYVFYPDV